MPSAPTLRSLCNWKSVLRKCHSNIPSVRSMATTSLTITSTAQPRLPPPLRSKSPVRKPRIKTYPPPPSTRNRFPDAVSEVNKAHLAVLDPTGVRQRLFTRSNPDCFRPGDILLVTFKTGDPFAGVCLSIKRRGPDTSVLLRNHILMTGVEMSVKVYSPTVTSIELVKRAERRIRRARLYYMRKPKHDRGSVENVVEQYLKARRLIRGGAVGKRDPKSQRQQQDQNRK